jgi:hypothetical protein
MLGPDCVLVHRTPAGFHAIDHEAAVAVQKSVLGGKVDQDWLFRQCRRIADALNKGEIALAQIYGLRIPVGRLEDVQLRRIAAASLAKTGFNPSEPRVPRGDPRGGEWTVGGGSSSLDDASAADLAILADLASDPTDTPGRSRTDANQAALQMMPTSPSAPDSIPDAGQVGDEARGDNGDGDDDPSSNDLIDVAYPGVYHNLIVGEVAEFLRARGAIVITEVDLVGKNGATARADIIAILPSGITPVIVEIKTGLDPQYTSGQQVIYPMAQVGNHVYSPNAKIEFLGFLPGQWLPPMVFFTVYKQNAQSPFSWLEHPDPIVP